MLNKIKTPIILTALMFIGLFSVVPPAGLAVDAPSAISCGVNSAASGDCNKQPTSDLGTTVGNIVNLLSIAVGVVAVIMIIVAGFRYVTSAGNPESAKAARNTILYAVVGLVIVSIAQIIVHFVLNNVG